MNVLTLVGMPGSGKSTVGVLLAKRLGWDFVDTDLTLQRREGALLQDILDQKGLETFLDLEGDAICSLRVQKTVVAPGGSCIFRDRAMTHLKGLGPVVYLRLSLEELTSRLTNLKSRGIAFAPGQDLAGLYRQRGPLYARWADLTVDVRDGQSAEETLAAVLTAVAPLISEKGT